MTPRLEKISPCRPIVARDPGERQAGPRFAGLSANPAERQAARRLPTIGTGVSNVDLFSPREDIAVDLWRYGEDDLWTRPLTTSTRTMRRISELALDHLLHDPGGPSGDSMVISKALALAAVEVFEGEARPLVRERRRPESQTPPIPRVRGRLANWLDVIDMAYRGR